MNSMSGEIWTETIEQQYVTYTIEIDGKIFLIENVPSRVYLETGERFYSPETVERLQKMIWAPKTPKRFIEAPVYEFGG
jgi:hypothetical protein